MFTLNVQLRVKFRSRLGQSIFQILRLMGTLQKAPIFLVWAIRSIFCPVRFAEFAG